MNQQLKHIFDASACLSKRQLKDYASGSMSREEQHAVEHHATTCFFCSDALEGMMEKVDALSVVDSLSSNFLKEHFSLINPQIHLNSIAPSVASQTMQRSFRSKDKVQTFLKPTSIAAAVILGFGILWYLDFGKNRTARSEQAHQSSAITESAKSTTASATETSVSATQEENLQTTPIAGSTAANNDSQPLSNNNDFKQKQAIIGTNPETEKPTNTSDSHLKKPDPIEKKNAGMKAAGLTGNSSEKTGASAAHAGALNSAGNSASVKTKSSEAGSKEADSETATSPDALYKSGDYRKALAGYRKEMNESGSRAEQQAALQAARCHINLGQKENATKLLQSIAENGSGSSKRQARRLLKDLGKEGSE